MPYQIKHEHKFLPDAANPEKNYDAMLPEIFPEYGLAMQEAERLAQAHFERWSPYREQLTGDELLSISDGFQAIHSHSAVMDTYKVFEVK